MYQIGSEVIGLSQIKDIIKSNQKIELSDSAIEKVSLCRSFLEKEIETRESPIYGVNTGFGSLYNTSISKDEISDLQRNLVISHSCGTGDTVSLEIVRIMLLLKIINLSLGHSGIRIETLDRLIFMYNENILPVVYEQGSLGASGDLAPLAHLSLPLIHAGEVWVDGSRKMSQSVFESKGMTALVLGAKEGLALLNGTQFMSAYSVYMLHELETMMSNGTLISAAALDAFNCSLDPFKEEIQKVRPHEGQGYAAASIRSILEDSEIAHGVKTEVQDPYSFRCIPQVHGASIDAINYVRSVIEKEIRSVTDNPMIFPDSGEVISAGNFHGQPIALSLDFLAIAISELASISERRIYKLISGQRGLPVFLTPNPGLNSGFMIPQYTAASMVSQNKQLCTPASVDTIDSSNGQEDHVSMGANAATKCLRVLHNYQRVIGIELMNVSQALFFRRPKKSSTKVESMLLEFRKQVPFVEKDVEFHLMMKSAENFVRTYSN